MNLQFSPNEQNIWDKYTAAKKKDPTITVKEIFGEEMYNRVGPALARIRAKLKARGESPEVGTGTDTKPKRKYVRKQQPTMITMPVPQTAHLACVVGNPESIAKFVREITQ